jgi:hypothetical protein
MANEKKNVEPGTSEKTKRNGSVSMVSAARNRAM